MSRNSDKRPLIADRSDADFRWRRVGRLGAHAGSDLGRGRVAEDVADAGGNLDDGFDLPGQVRQGNGLVDVEREAVGRFEIGGQWGAVLLKLIAREEKRPVHDDQMASRRFVREHGLLERRVGRFRRLVGDRLLRVVVGGFRAGVENGANGYADGDAAGTRHFSVFRRLIWAAVGCGTSDI